MAAATTTSCLLAAALLLLVATATAFVATTATFRPRPQAKSAATDDPRRRHPFYRRCGVCSSLRGAGGALGVAAAKASDGDPASPLEGLRVGIVGGGPSGLLLALSLLKGGASRVAVFEKRGSLLDDPSGRYTFGLGARGRTAVSSAVDDEAWAAVKRQGYDSRRFHLYLPIPLVPRLTLRNGGEDQEPSLLLFQCSLCEALADELRRRFSSGQDKGRWDLHLGATVEDLNLRDMRISAKTEAGQEIAENFDLIVGCDGQRSIVREEMLSDAAKSGSGGGGESYLRVNVTAVPRVYKAVMLDEMPSQLDPTAVSALVAGKGGAGVTTAFIPTVNGMSCLLFASKDGLDPLLSSNNVTQLHELIVERYPKLEGVQLDAATKLAAIEKASRVQSVVCNMYHAGQAALVGDAAHGGMSGQGVNSALVDSAALSQLLQQHYDPQKKRESIQQVLLEYSKERVPEGVALYDLSFGPESNSFRKRTKHMAKLIRDTLFQGKWGIGELPLHTVMTSTLEPFASLRKERDRFYDEEFPDQSTWEEGITKSHEEMVRALSRSTAPTSTKK